MLTTSPNDHEALSALRKANAMLASANNNWTDFVTGKVKMVQERATDTPEYDGGTHYRDEDKINEMFQHLYDKTSHSSSFIDFIDSVYEWWTDKGFLTQAQYNAIKSAYERAL